MPFTSRLLVLVPPLLLALDAHAAPEPTPEALDRKCTAGDGAACIAYGKRFHTMTLEDAPEKARARSGFQRACEKKSGEGCRLEAMYYTFGWGGVGKDPVKAMSLRFSACGLEDAQACGELGTAFALGSDGAAKDAWMAVQLQLRACVTLGSADACLVAARHQSRRGDKALGRSFYEQACKRGQALACKELEALAGPQGALPAAEPWEQLAARAPGAAAAPAPATQSPPPTTIEKTTETMSAVARDIKASWIDLGAPFGSDALVTQLVTDGATVFAMVQPNSGQQTMLEKLYRSIDHGKTWTVSLDARPAWREDNQRIFIEGRTVVLRTKEGLLRSTDLGETWSPAGADRPMVLIGHELIGILDRTVWHSMDGALTWSVKKAAPGKTYDLAAAGSSLFIGVMGEGAYKDDRTWYRLDGENWTPVGKTSFYARYNNDGLLRAKNGTPASSADEGRSWMVWRLPIWMPNAFAAAAQGYFATNYKAFAWLPRKSDALATFAPPAGVSTGCFKLAATSTRLLTSCYVGPEKLLHVYAIELAQLK